MKQNNIANSITKEGIDKMKLLAGQSTSCWNIDLNTLLELFHSEMRDSNSAYLPLASVYEMGRIDGIRQEREKRNNKSNCCEIEEIKELQITEQDNEQIA